MVPLGDVGTHVTLIIRDGRGRPVAFLDLVANRAELVSKRDGRVKEVQPLKHKPKIHKEK